MSWCLEVWMSKRKQPRTIGHRDVQTPRHPDILFHLLQLILHAVDEFLIAVLLDNSIKLKLIIFNQRSIIYNDIINTPATGSLPELIIDCDSYLLTWNMYL